MATSAHRSDRQVISLNGTWHFAKDPDNVGRQVGWETHPDVLPNQTEIQVPSVWQELFPGYDGVAWYWHDFVISGVLLPPAAQLHFAAINYFAEVWLNGQYLGQHEGGYTPFDVD